MSMASHIHYTIYPLRHMRMASCIKQRSLHRVWSHQKFIAPYLHYVIELLHVKDWQYFCGTNLTTALTTSKIKVHNPSTYPLDHHSIYLVQYITITASSHDMITSHTHYIISPMPMTSYTQYTIKQRKHHYTMYNCIIRMCYHDTIIQANHLNTSINLNLDS